MFKFILTKPNKLLETVVLRKIYSDKCFRLYDGIIQSLTEMNQLNGVDENDQMQKEINAQLVSYKAFR